jgi:hypothetical protein
LGPTRRQQQRAAGGRNQNHPANKQKQQLKSNKWTQRMDRRQAIRGQQNQQKIIIDSGATLHFMAEDLNLPKTGPSQIKVFLTDNLKLQSSSKIQLPFDNWIQKQEKRTYSQGSRIHS